MKTFCDHGALKINDHLRNIAFCVGLKERERGGGSQLTAKISKSDKRTFLYDLIASAGRLYAIFMARPLKSSNSREENLS
jgi:hypothetical protein